MLIKTLSFFRAPLQNTAQLIVPTIVVYEVCRKVLHHSGQDAAATAFNFLKQGRMVALSAEHSFEAAALAQQYSLAMADALILQTALSHKATLYTQDAAFKGLPNVAYVEKQ